MTFYLSCTRHKLNVFQIHFSIFVSLGFDGEAEFSAAVTPVLIVTQSFGNHDI